MGVFSLYIHIPYCQAKCPYCDFNSHAAQQWPEDRYVDALCREMQHYAARSPEADSEVATVFFGGGTPSLFAPASIARILQEAARLWTLRPDAEMTLEANPGTVSLDTLSGFRQAGVNRISFGVQSFAPHHLQRLGRIHSADEARLAIPLARRAGFDNVSLDLMFALPQQSLQEWEADLAEACDLQSTHLSAYNLTYEEGTPFHQWRSRGMLQQLPEDIEVAMFTRTQEILGAAGYAQYEISNYARPQRECGHNLNYWRSGMYLGIGAGAHSYARTHPLPAAERTGDDAPFDTVSGWRWSNQKSPQVYIHGVERNGHARCAIEALDEHQARGEFVFLGLRCRAGFGAERFAARFGLPFEAAFPHARGFVDDGLLESVDHSWRLTPRGLLLADSVFATFL